MMLVDLKLLKKIKSFYDDYKKGNAIKGIYLSGNFGSGKSYLIGRSARLYLIFKVLLFIFQNF